MKYLVILFFNCVACHGKEDILRQRDSAAAGT